MHASHAMAANANDAYPPKLTYSVPELDFPAHEVLSMKTFAFILAVLLCCVSCVRR